MGFIRTFVRSGARPRSQQILVYWAFQGSNSFGKPIYALPVEMVCRWNDQEMEFIDPKGDRQSSSASVYVESPLIIESVIYLGRLSSLPNPMPLDPRAVDGTWEVRQTKMTPALNGRDKVYQAFI